MENAVVDVDSLFAEYLAGVESGQGPELEALCVAHPSAAPELRVLHEHWLRLASAIGVGGATDSLIESFGAEVDPRISIDGAPPQSRFRVKRVVGRGGMGIVFEVWDPEFRRRLAMKVVRSGIGALGEQPSPRTARVVSRFLQEAQITGQLQHPGVLPVHELGADASGQAWFTMPLVEGSTLAQVLDRIAAGDVEWSRERALEMLARVCETMAFAHSRDVIHRDLKPANVMVGSFGEVHVMDWGLARVLGQADRHDLRLEMLARHAPALEAAREEAPLMTMDGDVIGTPAYMSPEQARGELDSLGPQTDVYAVGAMLYHLLTGAAPYRSARGPHEVLAAVVTGPPHPIALAAPGAPPALVSIAERAMRREAADRYPDMAAMSADLRAYLEGRVVVAHESGRWAEARAWVRRNRRLSIAMASSAIFLLLGGIGMYVVRSVERSLWERFLDMRRLTVLQRESDELWPPTPDRVEAMEAWVSLAENVVSRRPMHVRELAQRTSRVSFAAGAERATDSELDAWIIPELRELVDGLEQLRASDPVDQTSIARMRARLDAARSLAERTTQDPSWEAAIDAIADPAGPYGGLTIAPQLGLLPLGTDPHSGLQEFAHLLTGEPPRRNSDGTFDLSVDSSIVLVLIPGARHVLGGVGDHPELVETFERAENEVDLDPFFISKYELTRAQWARWSPPVPDEVATDPSLMPMGSLSHDQGFEIVRRLGLILPTEAQWDYASRGGADTDWWWGPDYRDMTVYEVTGTDAGPSPVGSRSPNGYGLYDMLGNLRELVRDPWRDYSARASRARGDGMLLDVGLDQAQIFTARGAYFFVGFNQSTPLTRQMSRCSMRFTSGRAQTMPITGLRPARVVES
ncbi:bifunctional serine/threonine-protein kinase/formylglycine-generating enzyme family protein [Engelhardtia mirabilis]|uniref:Serine/threonine-protein kinase PknD n=1 Tax=Engelhardtia mirabilis TaxID=2528011 RepID=A0A518BN54_9BACT|nr:Serine/threonine-protein kinase PknD [Planctomycetes bacterium Pla133]QDV02736.1 Serine/threonine-protein kinase PknD [Planctomycetes bacterium Pla86]